MIDLSGLYFWIYRNNRSKYQIQKCNSVKILKKTYLRNYEVTIEKNEQHDFFESSAKAL